MSLAQGLGSRRVVGQIDLLYCRLDRWRQDPAVAGMRGRLKVLVDPFKPEREAADESYPAYGDAHEMKRNPAELGFAFSDHHAHLPVLACPNLVRYLDRISICWDAPRAREGHGRRR